MGVYDLEISERQLSDLQTYAWEHAINIIEIATHPNFPHDRRVRVRFPRGTFAAFQRQFDCFIIKKLA